MTIKNSEYDMRIQLAACYRMFSQSGLDDLIYTHLSTRIPRQRENFLFIRFGDLFEEVSASTLIKVNIEGQNIGDNPGDANPLGWTLHRTIYEYIPEAMSIMHLHTVHGTAVSAQKSGLLPINQFAITMGNDVGYHDYDGPGLLPDERVSLLKNMSLPNKNFRKIMFLRNHGTLTWGRSIEEAFILMHYLERSCKTQVAAQSSNTELVFPDADIIKRTANIGQGTGDINWSKIGFDALLRRLNQKDITYQK